MYVCLLFSINPPPLLFDDFRIEGGERQSLTPETSHITQDPEEPPVGDDFLGNDYLYNILVLPHTLIFKTSSRHHVFVCKAFKKQRDVMRIRKTCGGRWKPNFAFLVTGKSQLEDVPLFEV